MNRPAATLAVAALLGFLRLQGPLPQSSYLNNAQRQEPLSVPSSSSAVQTLSSASTPVEDGPHLAVCHYFETTSKARHKKTPAECVPEDYSGRVNLLIAIVPDPIKSYLALEYDRSMESIERAAALKDYAYESVWLPWRSADIRPQVDSINTDASAKAAAIKEQHRRLQEPGIIVFRRSDNQDNQDPDILLVFVVGEVPASGLDKLMFSKALDYIGEFGCSRDLDIAGPQFSASLYPLSEVFKERWKEKSGCWPASVNVISGSVENEEAIKNAKNVFANVQGRTGIRIRLDALAASENPPETIAKAAPPGGNITAQMAPSNVSNWMHQPWTWLTAIIRDWTQPAAGRLPELMRITGARPEEIACLSETASGDYGSHSESTGPGKDGICSQVFYFPRNIALLRNAYQALQDTKKKDADPLPQMSLPLSYREPEISNQDQIPIMAPDHTPYSQEAVMRQIVQKLRQEKIKAVIIEATSSFDTLFLMHYLRESAPNIRMVVLGADLLYIRTGDPKDFAGTLVLSDRPLFVASTVDPFRWHPRNPFASTMAVEHYAAVRAALQRMDVRPALRPLGLHATVDKPADWTGVLGKNGYWPLHSEPPNAHFEALQPSAVWYWLMLLMNAGAGLHYFLVWATHRDPGRWGKLWWTEYYSLDHGNGQYLQARGCFLLLATLQVAIMQIVFLAPTWRLVLDARDVSWFVLCFVAGSAAVFALCIFPITLLAKAALVRYRPKSHKSEEPAPALETAAPEQSILWSRQSPYSAGHSARAEQSTRMLAILFLVGCAATAVLWSRLCGGSDGEFFSYRAVFIFSGVSPALPMLLTGAGIYLCAMTSMRRITYFQTRFATFPSNFDPVLETGFQKLNEDLSNALTPIAFFSKFKNEKWLLALALGGMVYAFTVAPRSVEPSSYNLLVFAGIYAIWLLVLLATIRFLDVWRVSKKLLRRLERLPIRYPFNRIPTLFSWSPVWRLGGIRRSMLLQTRSLEYLRCLSAHPESSLTPGSHPSTTVITGVPRLSRVEDVERSLKEVLTVEAAQSRIDSTAWFELDQALRKQAEELIEDFLLPVWKRGGADSISEDWGVRRKDLPQGPTSTWENDRQTMIAAEFVALRFVAVIRYVSLQMRNLLGTISFGFVLALLAVKSYPFQPRQQIDAWIVVIFMVLSCTLVAVFTDMNRDAVLRRLSAPRTGKFSFGLLWPLVKFGALPLLTVLTSLFPSLSGFLFSWIEPALERLH